MNIKSILFPTDFSKYNDAALHYAERLAVESGATLHLLHAHDTRDLGAALGDAAFVYATQWEEEKLRAERRLARLTPLDPAVKCEHHLLVGIPDSEIVNFAKENNIDLIVMASHGRSGLSRLIMGSVAEAVMRSAPCPVLVVKQPVAEEIQSENEDEPAASVAETLDGSDRLPLLPRSALANAG
jgi:universal stress protein A